MAIKDDVSFAVRVKEATATSSTGPVTLGGAVTRFRTFLSTLVNGDTCYYARQAVDSNGNPVRIWETGIGTKASRGNTLSRQVEPGHPLACRPVEFKLSGSSAELAADSASYHLMVAE
jgi:hypothetical protein